MSAIRITPFGGLLPSSDKSMIPSTFSQTANNCRLTAGTLDAYKAPLLVYTPAATAIKSIYRFDQNGGNEAQYWFTFNTDVDVVKGAVSGDTQERTYYTGDGYPKITDITTAVGSAPYPTSGFHLGTPAPTAASALVTTVFSPVSTTPAETFVYTYTFVTPWGEESPPAPASGAIAVKIGDVVTVSGLATTVAGGMNYNLGVGAHKRIYRSATGTSATNFLFVEEIPIAQTSYLDSKLTVNLGEVLPTLFSNVLPQTAKGLTNIANGIMAAFLDYDVYFCEAYKPYSFPVGYMQAVDYPVVGLGSFGTSLVVLTTGKPYVMTGTDPQSMTIEKLAVPYSCVSKRSICNAYGDVVYASPDGLVSIGQSGTKVLTDTIMTRLEWQAYKPSSMLCAVWDDRIFMFYDTGTAQGCLCLDSKQGLVTSDVYATASYNDPVTGELYLAIADKIVKWNAGVALTYTWKSKYFTHPNHVNFAWGQVLANDYPVTLNVYANQILTATKVVTSITPFRLPSGFKAKYWELELIGNVPVVEVVIAETMEELRSV